MTYVERFAALVADVESAIKRRKSYDWARYTYAGVSYDVADRTQRMVLVERIADDYVAAHADVNQRAIDAWEERGCKGDRPVSLTLDTAMLDRLTNAILDEELTDTSRSKTYNEEYPFLSERQFDRRRDREYSLSLADSYDLDGVNRAKPERRRRTAKEQRFVEKSARDKNRKRNAQYKRDTTAGPVASYNLRDEPLREAYVAAASVGGAWRDALSSIYEIAE